MITSLTVSYSNAGAQLLLENDDDAAPPEGVAYAKLYAPPDVTPSLFSNGGPVSIVNQAVTASIDQILVFTGEASVNLDHPSASDVVLRPLGNFVDDEGNVLSGVSLVVYADTGRVEASRSVYGVVWATYTSTFQRVSAPFPERQSAYIVAGQSIYVPLIMVATADKYDPSVLTIDPPPEGGVGYSALYDRATDVALQVELDNTFPVALSHNGPDGRLSAVARVFVYAIEGTIDVQSSLGWVAADPRTPSEVVDKVESLQFVNTQSLTVEYPPVNGVAVSAVGNLYSQQERGAIISFATAGERVNLVEYAKNGSYSYVGSRTVGDNEVVAVSYSHAVPVTGIAIARYSTKRLAYIVRWSIGDDWFQTIMVQARDAKGRMGSLTIDAPPRRGV